MSDHAPDAEAGNLPRPSPSAGALLRQARESAGLHVAALAVAMKVPVKKLEALEADRYHDLPDTTFTRALAASVCRSLKIDAAPILERLPQGPTPVLRRQDTKLNAPFKAQHLPAQPSIFASLSKPTLAVVALLLLGALLVVFWPNLPSVTDTISVPSGEVQGAPIPVGPADPTVQATSANPEAVSSTIALAASPDLAPAAASADTTASAASASAPALAVGGTGVDPANALIVFKAVVGDSWVQVTDAKGKNILRRSVQLGEAVSAGGALPLSVVVGRANAMEVTVRGQRFELATHTRDNVAKFEVK